MENQGKTRGKPGDNGGTTSYIHSHPTGTHIQSTSLSTATNAADKGVWQLSTSSTGVMSMTKRHTSPSLTSLWVWIWGQGLAAAHRSNTGRRSTTKRTLDVGITMGVPTVGKHGYDRHAGTMECETPNQGDAVEIRLERDVMAEAVAWAARSLPNRPTVPILAGLLVRAEGDSVVMSASDNETSAQITLSAQVDEPGESLVSGKLLADIARSLPNKPVQITTDPAKMDLVCGSARFTLQALPVDEYPDLPQMPAATGTVDASVFSRAVAQVVVAAGRDELLPVFTGVRVEINRETLSLLATDRYRMALKEITWNPSATDAEATALVPAKVINETARSMTSGEHVTMNLSSGDSGEGLVGFEGDGANGVRRMTTRLLSGNSLKCVTSWTSRPLVRCGLVPMSSSTRCVAFPLLLSATLRCGWSSMTTRLPCRRPRVTKPKLLRPLRLLLQTTLTGSPLLPRRGSIRTTCLTPLVLWIPPTSTSLSPLLASLVW